jgi:hypothetical protein
VHGLSYRIKSVRNYSLILADKGVYWSLIGSKEVRKGTKRFSITKAIQLILLSLFTTLQNTVKYFD